MSEQDFVNLSEWQTVEEAVKSLAEQGLSVAAPQLYQRAMVSATNRRQVSIQARTIFGRLVLLRTDVLRYGHRLKQKRAQKPKERRQQL